ncbi:MAG: radical SAM protein [Acidobacteriota bacterium]|nr:radical SAM protein [Acidobacteriota bacterium]
MLFDTDPSNQLVGIARLAASSDLLEAKARVEYFDLPTRRFIGRCSGWRMPFVWTVNPYRGCEFGCKYCYARFAHEFMELREPGQFETKIYAKQFSARSFRAELSKVKRGESIWIGTATDPYQPAERRFRITRQMLEILAEEKGHQAGITTKSDLIARDVDLLAQIARRNVLHINITITTLDEPLARALEPLAPRPQLRLDAIRKLADAGLRITVLANPVLPLITDSFENLDGVCAAAQAAGAASFSAAPVFLKPCAQQVFLPFLEDRFPHLLRRYRERFERSAYLKGHYPAMLQERVKEIVARRQMKPRDAAYQPEEWTGEPQMELFAGVTA